MVRIQLLKLVWVNFIHLVKNYFKSTQVGINFKSRMLSCLWFLSSVQIVSNVEERRCGYRSEWDQTALKRAPVNRRKTRSKITYFSRFQDNKKPGLIKNKTTEKKGQCTKRSTRTSLNWKTKVAVNDSFLSYLRGQSNRQQSVCAHSRLCRV